METGLMGTLELAGLLCSVPTSMNDAGSFMLLKQVLIQLALLAMSSPSCAT